MRIGLLSDIHLSRKTNRLTCALNALTGISCLLIAGDLADRADPAQYDFLHACIRQQLGDTPVYCVSGNHDNPARNDAAYRQFEQRINPTLLPDECGAFRQQLSPGVELIGLNPTYHQKQFFFPERGRQLDFLQHTLAASTARTHIILCHPPLLLHNPQRDSSMQPYIAKEQNDRLQQLVDEHSGILFVSGHTHLAPTAEWDEARRNLYINNGSICPTTAADKPIQQGNATLLEIGESALSLCIQGIHTGKLFHQQTYPR